MKGHAHRLGRRQQSDGSDSVGAGGVRWGTEVCQRLRRGEGQLPQLPARAAGKAASRRAHSLASQPLSSDGPFAVDRAERNHRRRSQASVCRTPDY